MRGTPAAGETWHARRIGDEHQEAIALDKAAFVIEVPLWIAGRKASQQRFEEKTSFAIDRFAQRAGTTHSAFVAELAVERFQQGMQRREGVPNV